MRCMMHHLALLLKRKGTYVILMGRTERETPPPRQGRHFSQILGGGGISLSGSLI